MFPSNAEGTKTRERDGQTGDDFSCGEQMPMKVELTSASAAIPRDLVPGKGHVRAKKSLTKRRKKLGHHLGGDPARF